MIDGLAAHRLQIAAVHAAVVELADTRDLKSLAYKADRFESGQRHQMRIWRNWQTRRSQKPLLARAGSNPAIRTTLEACYVESQKRMPIR